LNLIGSFLHRLSSSAIVLATVVKGDQFFDDLGCVLLGRLGVWDLPFGAVKHFLEELEVGLAAIE
jgi:hypothetical protein